MDSCGTIQTGLHVDVVQQRAEAGTTMERVVPCKNSLFFARQHGPLLLCFFKWLLSWFGWAYMPTE